MQLCTTDVHFTELGPLCGASAKMAHCQQIHTSLEHYFASKAMSYSHIRRYTLCFWTDQGYHDTTMCDHSSKVRALRSGGTILVSPLAHSTP